MNELADSATVAQFVAYDMPADFVADLAADIAAIGDTGSDQAADLIDSAGETIRVRALIQEGRDMIKELNTSVRNRYRHDPEILAEWRAASRIHRTPRTTPAPAPEPQS